MPSSTFFKIPAWLREIVHDPFRRYLLLGLLLLGIGLFFHDGRISRQTAAPAPQIAFFHHPHCPHCRRQEEFIPALQAKYPETVWTFHDTSIPENVTLLATYLTQRNRSPADARVPTTFIGPLTIVGFESAQTTGMQLEQAIRALRSSDPALVQEAESSAARHTLDLPFWGPIPLAGISLPALAVIIGLVDGFNPCAMWVLVYLISLIASVQDRGRAWLLVTTFVASSGILYFLFMTAWLNAFLFLGYLRPLTLIIGIGALYVGLLNIREYVRTRGQLTCTMGDAASRQKTRHRIDRLVAAPLTLFSVLGIIALACMVNAIEFACSAALPAIFTHTLTLKNLPQLTYYGYILLYDFFFMLDDLIIFGLAVLALDTNIGQRYAAHCRIIGGVVLIGLGGVMVFRPELLR